MKIWHPDTTCLCGGPKTFMKYFDEFFEKELVSSPHEADIIFGLNNWVPLDILKNRKCKYIHRANGVYRPILLNYPDWKERNESMKPHYLEADHVIFQSVFSRRSYFEYLEPQENYSIIHNGVDVDNNIPIIYNKTSTVLMLGKNLTKKENIIKDKVVNEQKLFLVKNIKKFDNDFELHKQLIGISVAVDPDPQANCNNLDLELMALGIPVVCLAEGGNPEICLPELISSPEDIVDKIQYVLDNQEFFSKRAREHVVNNFNIKDCLEKYRKVFAKILNEPYVVNEDEEKIEFFISDESFEEV